jgi:deoxyribonuclease IV
VGAGARRAGEGAGAVCFHPGAATDGDREASAKRIATAIVHAIETVPGDTRVLVENTAGAGNTMARTAEEVGAILSHVPTRHRARTGYGLDTCHLYASGYDLRASHAEVTRVLDAFEEAAGEVPGFFHLNDSEGELASNRDRHSLATARSAPRRSAGCSPTGARAAFPSSSRPRSSTTRSPTTTRRRTRTTCR